MYVCLIANLIKKNTEHLLGKADIANTYNECMFTSFAKTKTPVSKNNLKSLFRNGGGGSIRANSYSIEF